MRTLLLCLTAPLLLLADYTYASEPIELNIEVDEILIEDEIESESDEAVPDLEAMLQNNPVRTTCTLTNKGGDG